MQQFTRIYKETDANVITLKTGSIAINAEHVVAVRPNNALGRANGHRTTVELVTGTEIHLTMYYSAVLAEFGVRRTYS